MIFYGMIQLGGSLKLTKIREDIEENTRSEQENYDNLPQNILDKLEWFKDQKIGVIFHWGLYSIAGIVESWQLSEEDQWARGDQPWRNNIDELRSDYWGLNHSFNPYNFDPDEWASICKKAGFRYMLFTTKHHDGFNMYDTAYSDYKVTQSPCPYAGEQRSDIFGSVAAAFRKKDIHVGAYYSKADWHSPFYWSPDERAKGRYASYHPIENPKRWQQFNQFAHDQLVEICRDYGDLDILWLDGGWVNTGEEILDMDTIASDIRRYQDDLLIVDRTIGGKYENYVTPERKIPEIPPKKAWESNIPIAKNWGFCPNDQYKSFEEILDNVIQVVALGGNIILGVGPKPDGSLPRESVAVLEQLGNWLNQFGFGIYDTRPAEITVPEGWYLTKKNNTIFAFARNGIAEPLPISAITDKVTKVTNLNSKRQVSDSSLTVDTDDYYQVYQID